MCAGIYGKQPRRCLFAWVNRFPRFVKGVNEGFIRPGASPELVHSSGSVEQWNGNLGPGMLNAEFATERAMELAEGSAIGMVGLANTNHWMRAGTYGWQAARKGFILICWTNTCPNMPAWGARDPRLGNNPMVFAVPWKDTALVLDFAMSLFRTARSNRTGIWEKRYRIMVDSTGMES
jgi:3-dehydro-L-gulonate 2-dehydrogenase